MAFINTETGKQGTLFELLPKVSSPENLSGEELAALNILKVEIQTKYDIEEHKNNLIDEINNTYEEIRNEGYLSIQGIKMDFDEESVSNYTQAFILMKETNLTNIDIIDYNNLTQTVIFEDFKSILTQIGQKKIELLHTRRKLKDLVLLATTEEELNNLWWRKQIVNEETNEVTGIEYNPILGGD